MAVVLAFVMRILLLDALILSFVTIDIALDFWNLMRSAMVGASITRFREWHCGSGFCWSKVHNLFVRFERWPL